MNNILKKYLKIFAPALVGASLIVGPFGVFADDAMVVTGDMYDGATPVWLFNRDADTSTPFEFNSMEASIGDGSLYVLPIGGDNAKDKFIAEHFLQVPVADFNSVSYDFLIAGDGTESDANQFYLNVYTNIDQSDNYYDCRFDYVPGTGSTIDFETATFNSDDTPVHVQKRGDRIESCPETLSDMPEGSYVSFIAINVGDTSLSDEGLAGYLDNVVVDLDSDVTTYDFEPLPPFEASAEITLPLPGTVQSGVVSFTAEYVDEDGDDSAQWAVRSGTCAAGTNTVYGNVDGKNTDHSWDGASFSADIDMTNNDPGEYCFIFNPKEDAGDPNLRETSEFTLEEVVEPPYPSDDPENKNQCKKGGWKDFGFKNQGQCIKFANTGKDSR